jgi:hypothetical protein
MRPLGFEMPLALPISCWIVITTLINAFHHNVKLFMADTSIFFSPRFFRSESIQKMPLLIKTGT